jgi:addiction module HigA family antidote
MAYARAMPRRASNPPPHPGEVFSLRFLEPRGLRQCDFADAIGMEESNLSTVSHGLRAVTSGMALGLAQALGTTPRY